MAEHADRRICARAFRRSCRLHGARHAFVRAMGLVSSSGALLAAAVFVLFLCGGGPAVCAAPGEVTELWQGSVLGAGFRAGVCFAASGDARGVLLLTHANGQTDVYHLAGRISDNAFELRHGSGHVFRGRLLPGGKMEGRVRLNNGLSLSLSGTRRLDVPLAPDCAPLAK